MPELPEVETLIRDLQKEGIEGKKISNLRILGESAIAEASVSEFSDYLKGSTLLRLRRRGKFLLFHLSQEKVALLHLRMSGRLDLNWAPVIDPYARVILSLEGGRELVFSDTRKFGRWYIGECALQKLKRLGKDALSDDWDLAEWQALFRGRSRALKALLLDQQLMAGIGNIYADEILFSAQLHPLAIPQALSESQLGALKVAVKTCLHAAVANRGTSIGHSRNNFASSGGAWGQHQKALFVYRRHGLPCLICQTKIERLVVCGRSSHYCPICQPLL